MTAEHCKDHVDLVTTLTEVRRDVKWIKKELEERNGTFADHIKKSDGFRPQIVRNTAFRLLLMWAMGSGTILAIVGGVIWRLSK